MHIPDGFLNVATVATTYAVSAGGVGNAVRIANKKLGEKQVPLMGVLAAFIFAASSPSSLFCLVVVFGFCPISEPQYLHLPCLQVDYRHPRRLRIMPHLLLEGCLGLPTAAAYHGYVPVVCCCRLVYVAGRKKIRDLAYNQRVFPCIWYV